MAQPETRPLAGTAPAAVWTRLREQGRAVPAWAWVAGLTALALALRRYHIGVESFWFDEADIVRQAQAPLAALLVLFTHAGENGPLYTLLLHFWVLVAGTNEAAVRALPMAFGTATVPVLYYMGRRLAGHALGLLAAGLLAVSPFHIWYSQDAKMYTLVVLVTLASTTLYIQALDRGGVRTWAAYVLVTWVALFTHGLAVLILLAQLVAAPLLWPRAPRADPAARRAAAQRRRHWAIALLVLVVPFLPTAWERLYALIAGNLHGEWYVNTPLGDILGVLFVKFAVNRAPQPWEAAAAWVAGALFVLGLLPWVRGRRQAWAFLLMVWAAPILFFWIITLRVPLFEPRYLIIVLPFYLLFVAAGVLRLAQIARPVAGAALLLLLLLDGVALASINYSPEPQKEEWRQAIDYVRQHARGRDIIIVHPGYLKTAVDLYYGPTGDVPAIPIEPVPYLNTANFGQAELIAWLKDKIGDHERAWLILSPPRTDKEDPDGKVLQFFDGKFYPEPRYYQFAVQDYIGVKVIGYAFNGQPHSWYPKPTYPQTVAFAGGFNFLGAIYETRGDIEDQVSNAGWLPLTLYWRFDSPPQPDQDYIFAIQVVEDATGREWAAYDLPPLNGYRPTTTFPARNKDDPAGWVIDYPDIFIPGNAPPGAYHLTLQVWPRCSSAGVCWDPAHPHDHAGRPLAVLSGPGTTPGASTVTLVHPLHIVAWHPPGK